MSNPSQFICVAVAQAERRAARERVNLHRDDGQRKPCGLESAEEEEEEAVARRSTEKEPLQIAE